MSGARKGDRPRRWAARAERVDLYLRINGPFLPAWQAAERLSVSVRTICRYRAELGLSHKREGR